MSIKTNNSNSLDLQLWTQMKDGSDLSFNKLVKIYFNILINYGYKFVRDEDFVKDCVQEVFIEVWKRKEKLTIPDNVKAYLLGSVRRKVVREGYRQKIEKGEIEIDYENNINFVENSSEWFLIEGENEKEINAKVEKALLTLPKRQREVIYLQYYQNLSREEIAKIMNINNQSVSNLLQVAFKTLKENWKNTSLILFFLN